MFALVVFGFVLIGGSASHESQTTDYTLFFFCRRFSFHYWLSDPQGISLNVAGRVATSDVNIYLLWVSVN